MDAHQTLPDYIKLGLDILFIGINPGIRSAKIGHHFAGHSNRFWKLLNETSLVPHHVTYEDDRRLTEWGLGFTNIVSRTTKGSGSLTKPDYLAGREALGARIRHFQPRILALLGMTLYPILFPKSPSSGKIAYQPSSRVKIGLCSETFEGAKVVLLPNPSGRNAHYSYQEMLKGFQELDRIRRNLQN